MSNNYFNVKKVMAAILLLFFFNLNAQDCNQPSNFATGQTGMMHARINWFAPQPELGYEWELTLNGSTDILQSGTVQNATLLITGLTAETPYQLKVRSQCAVDTYSDWIMHYFTTAGATITEEGEIGNGADANTLFGATYGPIMYTGVTSRNGSVANMLFSTTEMQNTGIPNGAQITGVAFNKVNAAHNGDGYPDLRMRLFAKNSNAAAPLSLTTTFGDLQADHTEVMDDPSFDLPATTGWIDFNFETPFTYNGGAFELATAMYQTLNVNQFSSSSVIWQFTNGFKDYMIGAWPINTVAIDYNLILNHQSGGAQYKNRPNIKIYYAVSNVPTALYITTPNAIPSIITQNNGSLQLFSSIVPSYVSQQVLWQIVSGGEYATLSENGLVSALDNGTVTIQAISADNAAILDTIDVVISGQLPAVVSVDITVSGDAAATITTDNGTLQLNALVLPAEANQNVIWSITAGSDFATVDANGLVTALDNGTVTVQAVSWEDNTILDIIDVVITNQIVPVASVKVSVANNAAATITTDNGTLQLNALILPSNSNQNIVWSISAGSDFATVDANGLVTALDSGIITVQAVSAENNTILDTIDVVITNQVVPVASLVISVENDAQPVITTSGGTLQLIATVAPANSEQDATWSIVSGSEFVSVNADGLVTAISNGTAIIKAVSTENADINDTIEIVVSGILGSDEFNRENALIYPNPSQSLLTIQSQFEIRQIAIYSIEGRKVLEGNGNTINIVELPQSNYILIAQFENGKTITKKIVKN